MLTEYLTPDGSFESGLLSGLLCRPNIHIEILRRAPFFILTENGGFFCASGRFRRTFFQAFAGNVSLLGFRVLKRGNEEKKYETRRPSE